MGRGGSGGRGHGGHGGGFGRGRGKYGQGGLGLGSGGDCVCPDCGQRVPHTPGFPCSEEICPSCGAMMVRDTGQNFGIGKMAQEEAGEAEDVKTSKKVAEFPVVDVNLCTGCGICIEKCPFDSIVMKNGKALILNDNCRKCMICVKVCPENAIA